MRKKEEMWRWLYSNVSGFENGASLESLFREVRKLDNRDLEAIALLLIGSEKTSKWKMRKCIEEARQAAFSILPKLRQELESTDFWHPRSLKGMREYCLIQANRLINRLDNLVGRELVVLFVHNDKGYRLVVPWSDVLPTKMSLIEAERKHVAEEAKKEHPMLENIPEVMATKVVFGYRDS